MSLLGQPWTAPATYALDVHIDHEAEHWMTERRRNHLGRWVVWLHTRYAVPRLVPLLWVMVVILSILQIVFVTLG